jgi:hypothetical protein
MRNGTDIKKLKYTRESRANSVGIRMGYGLDGDVNLHSYSHRIENRFGIKILIVSKTVPQYLYVALKLLRVRRDRRHNIFECLLDPRQKTEKRVAENIKLHF